MILWRGIIKVMEEMAELGQVLAKLQVVPEGPHWDEQPRSDGRPGEKPLRQRLVDEAGDVYATLDYFCENNLTHDELIAVLTRRARKRSLYEGWVLSGVDTNILRDAQTPSK